MNCLERFPASTFSFNEQEGVQQLVSLLWCRYNDATGDISWKMGLSDVK